MKKRENFIHFGFFCCTGALPLTYLSPIFIRRSSLSVIGRTSPVGSSLPRLSMRL